MNIHTSIYIIQHPKCSIYELFLINKLASTVSVGIKYELKEKLTGMITFRSLTQKKRHFITMELTEVYS